MPPPVFGMGLIEAIPEETILALADPDDEDGDGISGRANMVTPPDWVPGWEVGGGPGVQLGRFGRKSSVSSLLQQVAQAYQQDMGITSDYLPQENDAAMSAVGSVDHAPDPEIPLATVHENTAYVRLLAPPAWGEIIVEVERGEEVFEEIGCASCHVPTLRTGPHDIVPLSEVDVHLYSDLLLHDMGEDLADGRPDGDAKGREWGTAPLWGTRLAGEFNGGRSFYLHDGRATSIEGAIDYHGGEGAEAREKFGQLTDEDRPSLLSFVRSL